jgi:glycosyltransferase involved in cell wall biosynthesis
VTKRPKISVVTPSYNQGEHLPDLLESIQRQEVDSFEHVVVDNESTDRTNEVLGGLPDDYPLRLIQELDEGQSDAVNKGIRAARGEWVAWQNADDFFLPGAFCTVLEATRQRPEADVIYGDVRIVDAGGERKGQLVNTRPSWFVLKYWSMFVNNQAAFFRRGLLEDLGGLSKDHDLTMDTELVARLLRADDVTFHHVPETLGAYRQHAEAKTFGGNQSDIDRERRTIFRESPWDRVLPRTALQWSARFVKLGQLLTERGPRETGSILLRKIA